MAEKANGQQPWRKHPTEDAKEQTIPLKQSRQQFPSKQAATSGSELQELEDRVLDKEQQIMRQ